MKHRNKLLIGGMFWAVLFLLIQVGAVAQQVEGMNREKSSYIGKELTLLNYYSVHSKKYETFNFTFENTPLSNALQQVANRGNLKLLYNHNLIPKGRSITMRLENVNLREAFDNVLRDLPLRFQDLGDGYIVILPELNGKRIDLQPQTISGTVTDAETGESLPGVNISIQGTTRGTSSGADGMYKLSVPSLQDTLIFSFIGYQSQVIPINGRTEINVALIQATLQGEELVVVGYGSQRRSDITGSVTSVNAEEIESVPVTDAAKALQGKIAGLNITQNDAIPGVAPNIMVRGQNSISADNAPLLIVDGVPFSGSLNNINQNDITSISVLKGPSATAIYGTRGSNGVILVETKDGQQGAAQISYSGHVGFGELAHILEPASPKAYLEKYRWYQLETGVPESQLQPVPNSPGGNEYANYQNDRTVDWIDEVTQPGYTSDNTLSISGASNTVNYYLSGEFLKQQGAIKGYQFTRNNVRAKINADVTDYLEVRANLFYNHNNYDGGQANFLMAAEMSPYGSVYHEDGSIVQYPVDPELLYFNPLRPLNRDRISRYNRLDGKAQAIFKPGYLADEHSYLRGLEFQLNTGYTYAPSREGTYTGRAAGSTSNGSARVDDTEDTNWVIENILTYKTDIGDHHFDFTGLYSAQEFNHYWSRSEASGFVNDLLSFDNLSAGSTQASDSDKYSSTLLSQMVRLNYSFKSKYLLTLTARRDGYSAFGSNTDKYGMFPSAAVGWNISNETFMQEIDAIDNLKIRFSYGKAGNQGIDPNQTKTINSTQLYPFNGLTTIGTVPDVLGNADLQWETSLTANLGLDFGLFNNRIRGTIDLYNTTSKDLLLERHIPSITGYSSVLENIGEVNNKGLELSLNTTNYQSGDFTWTTDITFATNHNEIVDLYGDKQDDLGNQWFIGKSIHAVYDYDMLGVWQNDEADEAAVFNAEPGDLKFRDLNGDNEITAEDRTVLGSEDPKWTGGISNTFYYKDFSLRIFVQTVQGVLKDNQILNWVDLAGRRNIPAKLTYWTPENNNNEMPALSYTNTVGYAYPRDASYVRLKDVTLSYTLPKTSLDRIGIRQLRLYVSGSNLYTWTDWLGWDPESYYAPRGWNTYETNYPLERTIVFGVNLGL